MRKAVRGAQAWKKVAVRRAGAQPGECSSSGTGGGCSAWWQAQVGSGACWIRVPTDQTVTSVRRSV